MPEVQPRVRRIDPLRLPDLHKEFLVAPGARVKLGEIDPGYRGRYDSVGAALAESQSSLT